MTFLDMDPSERVSPVALAPPTSDPLRSSAPLGPPKISPVPRVSLKKRSATSADPERSLGLATVNSAFLSGLFADVAKVQQTPLQSSAATVEETVDPRLDSSRPLKKSRVTLSKSISRCGRSLRILEEALDILQAPASPTGICDSDSFPPSPSTSSHLRKGNHSLLHQLGCVSSSPEYALSAPATPVFPHLPATISNTSCSTITRTLSDLQSSVTEQHSKEDSSYGWFVEMDDSDAPPTGTCAYASTGLATSSSSLAFSALSAPKAANQDAEVEWAKAADTVDDVLGDFF